MIESKAWNWEGIDDAHWRTVSDEFLPTALMWKSHNRHRVFDLGCGIGRNAMHMARMGFDVYAFDLSDSGLSRLAREAENEGLDIKIKKGDMLSLPYDDAFFDCVLAFHSIYHTDYKGLSKVLSEIRRVLCKGGEAYITLNSKESDEWRLLEEAKIDDFTLMKTEPGDVDLPHTYLSYEEVMQVLARFTIVQVQQIFDYGETKKHAHFHIKLQKPTDG